MDATTPLPSALPTRDSAARQRTSGMPIRKYQAFEPIDLPERAWPSRQITEPPIWCSVDLRDGMSGGSMEEVLTVYSIVDSVALNVAEIRAVGILINGKPVESLNGHLDLCQPLVPDLSLIVDELAIDEPPPPSPRRRPSILAVGLRPL